MFLKSLKATVAIMFLLAAFALYACQQSYQAYELPGKEPTVLKEEAVLSENDEHDIKVLQDTLTMVDMDREIAVSALGTLRIGRIDYIASIEPVNSEEISDDVKNLGISCEVDMTNSQGESFRVAFFANGTICFIASHNEFGGGVININAPLFITPAPR
ncbi:MAG: hypothetical protein FWD72_00685 [Eggerthellaceae bacterium]|nr:hypothetical protein [Eggerthellaceae bacterium]